MFCYYLTICYMPSPHSPVYKALMTAKIKAYTRNKYMVCVKEQATAVSNVSLEDAKKKAYEKAKQKAIQIANHKIQFANNITHHFSNNLQVKCNIVAQKCKLIKPAVSPAYPSTGYLPKQIKAIYNTPVVLQASGIRIVTIAIVIAYHWPQLQNDFNLFCSANQLPSRNLSIVNLGSPTNINTGWAQEECLDVQWAYAMNPNANILVVEAKSSSVIDLMNAVQYANSRCADVVSMSWGATEFGTSQIFYDTYFSNPSICYLAASGDANSPLWPAVSPNILACGGTTLTSASPEFTKRTSETTWSSAGCGVSTVYSKPAYQNIPNLSKYTNRVMPDISGVANPYTGVQIVFNKQKYITGGTSVSTPIIAGLISLVIQKRLNSRKPAITTSYSKTQTNLLQKILYSTVSSNSTYAANFFDVVSGNDGKYMAGGGVDVATGLGVGIWSALLNTITNY